MSTKEQREEWEALADAATPEPWCIWSKESGDGKNWSVCRHVGDIKSKDHLCIAETFQGRNDAKFIAAARTSVPALLDDVKKLENLRALDRAEAGMFRRERDEARAMLEELSGSRRW